MADKFNFTSAVLPEGEGMPFVQEPRRHFFDIGKNTNDLIANSEAVGSPNYALIARTIRLMSPQLTTDMFGDMPRCPRQSC